MKTAGLIFFAGLCLLLVSSPYATAGVESLRGGESITGSIPPPEMQRYKKDKENIPRTFEQQPPLVPHLNERYTINLKENECLECHMKEPGKDEAKSVEMSESHFVDRNGNQLDRPSAARHFCTQCHVPQVDAQPLVDSDFKSLAGKP